MGAAAGAAGAALVAGGIALLVLGPSKPVQPSIAVDASGARIGIAGKL